MDITVGPFADAEELALAATLAADLLEKIGLEYETEEYNPDNTITFTGIHAGDHR